MPTAESTIVLGDGFRVGVTQAGPHGGIPLVFLHGLSVSARAYTEVVEQLAGQGFRVIALDAADHGRSSSLPWGHTVRDMALIVRRALDKLHVMGGAVVVGHSMGGGIAAEYAAAYPGNVLALILLNAAVGQHHHETLRMGFTPEAALRAAELVTGALRDIIGDTRLAAEHRSLTELLSLGRHLAKSLSGARVLRAGVALLQSDTRRALYTIEHYRIPTVVIHGSDDRIINDRAALDAACIAGAKLEILRGYNHSWMIANPELAAKQVAAWARALARVAA